jgi:hypothetical protein
VIIISSCSAKVNNQTVTDEKAQSQTDSVIESTKANDSPQFSLIQREYFGTIAKASVNDNDVNIRLHPNISAEKIGKVNKGEIVEIRGFSINKEIIDGYNGYWLKVSITNDKDGYYIDNFGRFGWIFSKFVDIDPSVEVSTMKILKVNPKTDRTLMSITLELDRNGQKIQTEIVPDKMKNQNFYTFVWSDDIEDFLYSDPVGTFKWIPDTNEIQHLTYMGSDCESAWCLVTDNSKYFLQDYGTSPGPRGVGIFDLETNKRIYSETYYKDLEYDGDYITVVEVYNWWNVDKKRIDEDSIKLAEEFISKTSMTEEDKKWKTDGGSVDVIVKYRLNLITGEKKYLGSNYIHVQ